MSKAAPRCERCAPSDSLSRLGAVILDHIDDGQAPARRHVETFRHLALIGRAVAEKGDADPPVATIGVGEGQSGPERHLRADNAVAAIKTIVRREHMHGPAFSARKTAATAGHFGHYRLRIGAAGQQMTVLAIGGDELVAFAGRQPHADDDRLLADIEMAETADQPHPEQ